MKKRVIVLFIFLFVLVSLESVSCANIDAIKTLDTAIMQAVRDQNTTETSEWYGSFATKCWDSSGDQPCEHGPQEITYPMLWRYYHNLTNELGYPDPIYKNETIFLSANRSILFLMKNQSQNGWWGSVDEFVTREAGEAYILIRDNGDLSKLPTITRNFTRRETANLRYPEYTYYISNSSIRRQINITDVSGIYNASIVLGGIYDYDCNGNYGNIQVNINENLYNYTTRLSTSGYEVVEIFVNPSDLIVGVNNISMFYTNKSILCTLRLKADADEVPTNYAFYGYHTHLNSSTGWIASSREFNMYLNVYYTQTISFNDSIQKMGDYWIDRWYDWYGYESCPNLVKKFANQAAGGLNALYYIYNITGDDLYYNYSLKCLSAIKGTMMGGVFGERSGVFATNTPGNKNYLGYSSNYQHGTMQDLLLFYNLTQNETAKEMLNDSFNFLAYNLVYDSNNLKAQGARTTRSNTKQKFISPSNDSSFMLVPYGIFSSLNSYAKRLLTLSQNTTNSSWTTYSCRYLCSRQPLLSYLHWVTDTSPVKILPIENLTQRFFYNSPENQLVTIQTKGNTNYLSYGNSTPTGGVISTTNKINTQVLFSGKGDNVNHYGLGVLKIPNTNASNGFYRLSNFIIYSSSYPYKVGFEGNLSYPNETVINIDYNTTYTFYDDYIEVNQLTNSPVELQLWSVSTEAIGTGTINRGEITYKNNATFIPLNFNMTYNDSSASATWGTVDKFNASGTDFHYIIGVNRNNSRINIDSDWDYLINNDTVNYEIGFLSLSNALIYYSNNSIAGSSNIQDNDGNINITLPPNNYSYVLNNFNLTEGVTRENSPLWFTNTSNQKKSIASNITQDITIPIIVNYTEEPTVLYYHKEGSSTFSKYTPSNWTWDDTNKQLTINLTISQATGSNDLENGCITPYDGMQITEDTTFCPGTYNLNGTGLSGDTIINIADSADNSIIDCNGAKFIGNYTPILLGIASGSQSLFYAEQNAINVTFKNCYIEYYRYGFTQFDQSGTKHFTFINMTFNHTSQALVLDQEGNKVYNSTFQDSTNDGIFAEGFGADNNWFEGNTFIGGADGIHISSTDDNSENNTIKGNTFHSSYAKHGVFISKSNNNLIENNLFYKLITSIASAGLSDNNIIRNNTIYNDWNGSCYSCGDCHSIQFYSTFGIDTNNTIENNTIYNTLNGIELRNITNTLIRYNNLTNISYRAIRIYTNGTYNLTNNWFSDINYIQSGHLNTATSSSYLFNNIFLTPIKEYTFITRSGNFGIFSINIFNSNSTLFNSTSGGTNTIRFYNLTNALIYFSNNSIAGSSNIEDNDGNINITLPPNNYSYVLDNFNLTEGVTRENSPLWFSSASSTNKKIASNLTDTINATIVFNVDSCNIASINYFSNTGAYDKLITSYSCSNNMVTIPNLEGIEPSSSSNEIKILYRTETPPTSPPKKCTPIWRCYAWSICKNGIQTRNCVDLNNCGTNIGKPITSRSCTAFSSVNPIPAIQEKIKETIKCAKCPLPSDWSPCINGYKSRVNYECSKETNYLCKQYTEKESCVPPKIITDEEDLKKFLWIIPLIIGFGLIGLIIWFIWWKPDFRGFGKSIGRIFRNIGEVIIRVLKNIGEVIIKVLKNIGRLFKKGWKYVYGSLVWLFKKIRAFIREYI